ncbi:MAG: phytoene/squalene synthase family protein, partial [Syntrophothermus sp.]
IYVPQDELARFEVTDGDFDLRENNANFKALMQFQADRTMEMFKRGRKILRFLPFPLNKEISWTISGGELILKKIEKINYDVLNTRPVLSKSDYAFLAFRALIGR